MDHYVICPMGFKFRVGDSSALTRLLAWVLELGLEVSPSSFPPGAWLFTGPYLHLLPQDVLICLSLPGLTLGEDILLRTCVCMCSIYMHV